MDMLKCDICGGSLMMQAGGKIAVCDSCGMQYSVERVREKIQKIRGVVSVEGTVRTQDADFIIRGGVLTRYNGNDTHVVIPDMVVEIGPNAFENCAGIQSVKMPSSVTCIGTHAFSGCRLLVDVELSKNLTAISNWAFSGCTALKRLSLPDALVTIGNWAFNGCISLESINIPDRVQTNGHINDLYGTFENCPALREVKISDQQLNTLFVHKYCEIFYVRENIFEKAESDSDGDTYYVAENCGPWYLNLKHIMEFANEKANRRKRGLCQHCGAEFSGGFFSEKRCRNCGKPKDY